MRIILFSCLAILLIACGGGTNSQECVWAQKALKKRERQMFPELLKDVLPVVTFSENVEPVGLFAYQTYNYPSSLSLKEEAIFEGDQTEAKKHFADRFSEMARQLKRREKDVFFLYFQAGYDPKLQIDIGTSDKIGTYRGYSAEDIRRRIMDLHAKNIISDKDRIKLLSMTKDNPSYLEWWTLSDAVRQLYVLYWTLDEIIAQEKNISRVKNIALADVLANSPVKVGVIASATETGNYIKVINLIYLQYKSTEGVKALGDNPLTPSILVQETPVAPLKLAERIWLIGREAEDYELLYKLRPLWSSNPAVLNQISAEAKALETIAHSAPVITCGTFSKMIDQMLGFSKIIPSHSRISSNTLQGVWSTPFNGYERACLYNGRLQESTLISERERANFSKSMATLQELLNQAAQEQTISYLRRIDFDISEPYSLLAGHSTCPM